MKEDKKPKKIEVERMKLLMEGYTQTEFSNRTGIDQSTISKILSNQRKLTADNLVLLANAFDVSTDWILGRTDDRNPVKTSENPTNMTYGEIFRVLSCLLKSGSFYEIPASFYDLNMQVVELNNTQAINVSDKIVGSLIYEWHRTKTTSKDVFLGWEERRIQEYSKLPYLTWDAAIENAYNHYFGGTDVTPDTLAYFVEHFIEICKEIQDEKNQ